MVTPGGHRTGTGTRDPADLTRLASSSGVRQGPRGTGHRDGRAHTRDRAHPGSRAVLVHPKPGDREPPPGHRAQLLRVRKRPAQRGGVLTAGRHRLRVGVGGREQGRFQPLGGHTHRFCAGLDAGVSPPRPEGGGRGPHVSPVGASRVRVVKPQVNLERVKQGCGTTGPLSRCRRLTALAGWLEAAAA